MWTYKQLEQQSNSTIKGRALHTRDQVGADRLEPFSAAGGQEAMIAWLLYVQCQIASMQGLSLTPSDFGAPADTLTYRPRQHQIMAPSNGAQHDTIGDHLNQGKAALMVQAIHAQFDATTQATMARERNQRGSHIFG